MENMHPSSPTMDEDEVNSLVHRARQFTALGRYNEATVALTDGLSQFPRAWQVRLELAFNYVCQGYLQHGIAALQPVVHGPEPYPEGACEKDLIAFLYTALKIRHTSNFSPIWEACCRRIWDEHLSNLVPGKDMYSETMVSG